VTIATEGGLEELSTVIQDATVPRMCEQSELISRLEMEDEVTGSSTPLQQS
jgi:hypothetical protein